MSESPMNRVHPEFGVLTPEHSSPSHVSFSFWDHAVECSGTGMIERNVWLDLPLATTTTGTTT